MEWLGTWLGAVDWVATVAIATLVASLATLVLAIRERIERRRARQFVSWTFGYGGDVNETGTHIGHVMRLENSGTASASIVASGLVGATLSPTNNPRTGTSFPPARIAQLEIEPCDIDSVWLVLAYTDRSDDRWLHWTWMPLTGESLESELRRQQSARPPQRWRRMRQAKRTAPVGPGGAPYLRLRVDRHMQAEHWSTAMSIATQARATMIHK